MLPRAGLANRLLVWARAVVFAERWNLPLHVHGWGHIHVGPWLRGESSKRYYAGAFRNQRCWRCRWEASVAPRLGTGRPVVREPDLTDPVDGGTDRLWVFERVPSKTDYFGGLREARGLIRSRFLGLLRQEFADRFESLPAIDVAMHVRRGDFVTAGFTLTPESYFVETLNRIRARRGGKVVATVFTDAPEQSLAKLLAMPDVVLGGTNHDVLDMLHLSKSDILVTSLKSTFGYWGGFLSEAAIILHPEHAHGMIRGNAADGLFEGTLEQYL